MSMKYQFIAEFYQDKHSEKPIYKTHLWCMEDGEAFIKKYKGKSMLRMDCLFC